VIVGTDLPRVLFNNTLEDQPYLARDVVRYHGEPMALVAADSLARAREAAALIRVELDPLPLVDDPEAAMRADAPLLHPEWESYNADPRLNRVGNVCCHAELACGDVDEGFARADIVVESSYSTQSVHQGHLEPRVAIGVMDSAETVTVYCNTQLPFWSRIQVARVMQMPEESVRVVPLGIGGGFGSKLYAQIEPYVALLAQATKRPVRMVTTLEEELTAGLPRHPTRINLKTGVLRDGTIVAHQARMIIDAGAYAGSAPEISSIGALMLSGPYRIANIRMDGYCVYTNKTNFGAYRGPGGPQSCFALESHLDLVASSLGIDPLEIRLKNIAGDGDELANGQVLRGVGLREAVLKAAAAVDWDERGTARKALPARSDAAVSLRGKGLALGWWTTTLQVSTAEARLESGGKVRIRVGTQEIGTGAINGAIPQMAAEVMGVRLRDIIVEPADTSAGLLDWGSQGSRSAFNVGRAVQAACRFLLDKVREVASASLSLAAADLEVSDGVIRSRRDAGVSLSLSCLAASKAGRDLAAVGISDPEPERHKPERIRSAVYPAFHYPHFYCHACEVEVNTETGQIRVLRYAAAHDVGHAINPVLVAGQIEGGAVQGIGMALMEELRYTNGLRENCTWTDYKVPTFADVPEVQAIIVEHPVTGEAPYGMKGLGEAPIIPPPAALANAFFHATGVRIASLPMTADRVLSALQDRGRGAGRCRESRGSS
jgi:CO/xanthine dehydrogenase Mo-binding subunit